MPQRGTTIATIRKRRDKYEAQAAVPDFRTSEDIPFSKRAQAWAEQTGPGAPGPASRTMTSGMQGSGVEYQSGVL